MLDLIANSKEVLDKFYNSIDEKTIMIINKEIEDEK